MKLLNSYLEIPEVLVEPAVAGAARAALVTSKAHPATSYFNGHKLSTLGICNISRISFLPYNITDKRYFVSDPMIS